MLYRGQTYHPHDFVFIVPSPGKPYRVGQVLRIEIQVGGDPTFHIKIYKRWSKDSVSIRIVKEVASIDDIVIR